MVKNKKEPPRKMRAVQKISMIRNLMRNYGYSFEEAREILSD